MQPRSLMPELVVGDVSTLVSKRYEHVIQNSGLADRGIKLEAWITSESSHSLNYATHGIFRYFGKFPPTVARHLIRTYTSKGDTIVDPMCGSGTSALESVLLDREAICLDVNPLAVLLTKVKVTHLPPERFDFYSRRIIDQLAKIEEASPIYQDLSRLKNADHWFLQETVRSLARIKQAIFTVDLPDSIRDVFFLLFLSVVRGVSRATNAQGRLFLDAASAVEDAVPVFLKKVSRSRTAFLEVPHNAKVTARIGSILNSLDLSGMNAPLVICHPPYFNNYKYSSINSLELAWMGADRDNIRDQEVREGFKVGKISKISDYLKDMEQGLINLHSVLSEHGIIGLMIGDTILRGEHVPVTKILLERISSYYSTENIALRIPQFTEASWVASLRRNSDKLGVHMCDFVISLRRR